MGGGFLSGFENSRGEMSGFEFRGVIRTHLIVQRGNSYFSHNLIMYIFCDKNATIYSLRF